MGNELDKDRSTNELSFEEEKGKSGILWGIIIFGLLVTGGIMGGIYWKFSGTGLRMTGKNISSGNPQIIRSILASHKQGDEFSFLKFSDSLLTLDMSGDGKTDELSESYRALLHQQPENSLVRDNIEKLYFLQINRAEKYQRQKKYNLAMKTYSKAIKLKPGDDIARKGLKRVKVMLERIIKEPEEEELSLEEQVFQAVQNKMSIIKYLYNKEQRISPGLRGKITVAFSVLDGGKVGSVRIITTTVNNERLESAVVKHVSLWTFAGINPVDGNLDMEYPFIFYGKH